MSGPSDVATFEFASHQLQSWLEQCFVAGLTMGVQKAHRNGA